MGTSSRRDAPVSCCASIPTRLLQLLLGRQRQWQHRTQGPKPKNNTAASPCGPSGSSLRCHVTTLQATVQTSRAFPPDSNANSTWKNVRAKAHVYVQLQPSRKLASCAAGITRTRGRCHTRVACDAHNRSEVGSQKSERPGCQTTAASNALEPVAQGKVQGRYSATSQPPAISPQHKHRSERAPYSKTD